MKTKALSRHVATVVLFAIGSACHPAAITTQQSGNTGGAHSSGGSTGGAGTSSGSSGGTSSSGTSSTSGGSTSQGGAGSGGSVASGGKYVSGGAGGASGGADGAGAAVGSGGNVGALGGGTSSTRGSGGISGAGGGTWDKGGGGAGGAQSTGGTSGGMAGQTGASDAAAGQLTLGGLKIDANPKNVLSCFVSWTTDQAASSVVQFGVGKYEWEISDANLVTDHKVIVIGMHASQAYMVKAMSSTSSGSGSAEGNFTTDALPSTVPVAKITAVDATKMQAGWTLMNIQKGDGTASAKSNTPAQAVIYDAEGQPVWYYIDGTTVDRGGAVPTESTDKGVLIGATLDNNATNAQPPREVDFAGNTIWECATPSCNGTGNITHHATKLPNGHYIVNLDVTVGNVTAPVFEEIDANNKVVWSLDYRKLVPPPSSATGDWCHGNSITINMDKNEVYANCRFVGLIKTTYQNPSLIWHLPASYNGKGLGNMTFSPTTSQFSDTHDPEPHDDGTVLFFDNGGYDGVISEDSNPKGYKSRAVEYKIDETAKTATLVWEFPGTFNVDTWYKTSFYLPFWGDADRLANGNVLITAGVRFTAIQSRVFEVTKQDGKVVWEFQLPLGYGVYRAERLSPPPLVHAVAP